MSERADRKPKSIKIPGPDHPITIERNAHRIVVAVAGRCPTPMTQRNIDHTGWPGRSIA
jgi:hypothetical protein